MSKQKLVYTLRETGDVTRLFGSKSQNLRRLLDLGLNIPPSLCVPYSVITDGSLEEICQELLEIGKGFVSFAVRSDSLIEDGAGKSFAGRFVSKTHVRAEKDSLIEAVRSVYQSGDSKSVREYSGFEESVPVSVLVQPMIIPVEGGVVFSRDPTTGDSRYLLVETGNSAIEVVEGRGQRTYQIPRVGDLGRQRDFDLRNIALKIEEGLGFPVDIEFQVDRENTIYVVQARPITAVEYSQEEVLRVVRAQVSKQQERTTRLSDKFLLTDHNIRELFSDPSPLGFDVFSRIFLGHDQGTESEAVLGGRQLALRELGYEIDCKGVDHHLWNLVGHQPMTNMVVHGFFRRKKGVSITDHDKEVVSPAITTMIEEEIGSYPQEKHYKTQMKRSNQGVLDTLLSEYQLEKRRAVEFCGEAYRQISAVSSSDNALTILFNTLKVATSAGRLYAKVTRAAFQEQRRMDLELGDKVDMTLLLGDIKNPDVPNMTTNILDLINSGNLLELVREYGHVGSMDIKDKRYHEIEKFPNRQPCEEPQITRLSGIDDDILEQARLTKGLFSLRETVKGEVMRYLDVARQAILAFAGKDSLRFQMVFYLTLDELRRTDRHFLAVDREAFLRASKLYLNIPSMVTSSKDITLLEKQFGPSDSSKYLEICQVTERVVGTVATGRNPEEFFASVYELGDKPYIAALSGAGPEYGSYPGARALILPSCGPLSHAAVCAREARIPLLVGPIDHFKKGGQIELLPGGYVTCK